MKHKAQKINSEEWVEGYYYKYNTGHWILVTDNNGAMNDVEIKPETLQVQCSDGEWANVEDVEVVRKETCTYCEIERKLTNCEDCDRIYSKDI